MNYKILRGSSQMRVWVAFACVAFLWASFPFVSVAAGGVDVSVEVRNVSRNTSFENGTIASGGEVVEYRIKVTNTSSSASGNVSVSAALTNAYLIASRLGDNVDKSFTGNLTPGNQLSINSLAAGETATILYQNVLQSAVGSSNVSLCTTITASDSLISSNDFVCVTVNPNILAADSNAAITHMHSVWNDTQNRVGTIGQAALEDWITYTLTVRNGSQNSVSGYSFGFDVSGILPLADLSDTGGGILNGKTLAFNNVALGAGQSVEKKFKVRVKYFLPGFQYLMVSNFGNQQVVSIAPHGAAVGREKIAPQTGATSTLPLVLGLGSVFGYMIIKNRKKVYEIV